MRQVAISAHQSMEHQGEDLGLRSMTQFRVLKRLAQRPWLVSELAHDLKLTVPTVSVAVDGLVRRGLVERGEATDDRRANPLSLTAEGVRCYTTAFELMLAAFGRVFERMLPQERAALSEGLAALTRALDVASPESLDCMSADLHSKGLDL